MNQDRIRQAATVVAFALMLTLNALANALPLNGRSTASISDSFQVLVVPAGYVFAIWSLIYLGQAAFTVFQALPSRTRDPLMRRLGFAPAIAGVLNAVWIVAWHWEAFPLSLAIMLGLLGSLIMIRRRIQAAGDAPSGPERWAVRLPFSVYLGWIAVATIANATIALAASGFTGLGLPAEAWAVAVLLTGLAIGGLATVRARDAAIGLVFAWAYAGIAVKEASVAPVASVAAVGAAAMLALVAVVLVTDSRPARAHVATRAA